MTEFRKIVCSRDNISNYEFEELLESAQEDYDEGMDLEEILSSHFGLEPDFIEDLLTELGEI